MKKIGMGKLQYFCCPHCQNRIYIAPISKQLGASSKKMKQLNNATTHFDFNSSEEDKHSLFWFEFWNSDSGVNVTTGLFAGGGTWVLCWLSGFDPVWAVVSGLVAGVGLPLLKVILWMPPKPKEGKPTKQEISFRVDERKLDGRQILIDDIEDDRITLDMLISVAKAVITDGRNFSKPQLAKKKPKIISQNQYDWIKNEFQRLHYAVVTPANRTVLTLRGRSLLKKLANG